MPQFLPSYSLLLLVLLFPTLSVLRPICATADAELRALMDLKQSLDPENKYLKSWTFPGDPCVGFDGVNCNRNRKVANISLQGKGLSGRLSPSISELKSLTGLYLHFNSLNGFIPKEISDLLQLTDLYLDVNNLSGAIPPEIGKMQSLQVLQLCCNQLSGSIPSEIGSLQQLTVVAIQHNHLSGFIPPSLGTLGLVKRVDLSFNHLSGPIPVNVAVLPRLQTLDVRNNSLSGAIPPELRRLGGGFMYANNTGLCGQGFTLRACSNTFDSGYVNVPSKPLGSRIIKNSTSSDSQAGKYSSSVCNQSDGRRGCLKSSSSRMPGQIIIVIMGVIVSTVTLGATAGFLAFLKYRRQKQRIGGGGGGGGPVVIFVDPNSKSASPLVSSLAYSGGWESWDHPLDSLEFFQSLRFNTEDVESATHYFSEANVLGRGSFSTVYRGILRDGSVVAIKAINVTSCKAEEEEFIKGVNLLMSLRHDNLVALKGFCWSRGRGECFLIYDFAPNGNLARYLDSNDECQQKQNILDWGTRIGIIQGIAKGINYLHKEDGNKPSLVHQNLSSEKILIDKKFNPLILDSGLRKILADDSIYSALKVSAAMGYLAPEYITTGRFTEKSDVYSFGIVVFQILSGKQKLTSSMWHAHEQPCSNINNNNSSSSTSSRRSVLEEYIDPNLGYNFTASQATELVNLALACTKEDPSQRPSMDEVLGDLSNK